MEKIVVDDGSNPVCSSEIKRAVIHDGCVLLLRHSHGKNLGVSASRLLGLKYAKGDYVAFLDADDEFEEGKLAAQVEFLERKQEYGFVHTAVNVIGGPPELAHQVQSYFNSFDMRTDYIKLKYENKICFSSAMVRTSILRKLMFSLPYHHQYEDWALWNVLLEGHQGYFLSQPLTNYRVHTTSASQKIRKSSGLAFASIIELYLSLTVVFRDPIRKLGALFRLINVLRQRRFEMICGLSKLGAYRVEASYSNLLAVSLIAMTSKQIVVWGHGSLGKRLIARLQGDKVRISIVVDKRFDSETNDADVRYLSPMAFFQHADSRKQFLIVATAYYTEVVAQIEQDGRFSFDSLVVTDPACDQLEGTSL